jgi:peptidoglycan DL-endopeptidase CwlO
MKLTIPIIVAGAILTSSAVVAQADTGQHNPQPATAQGNIAAFQRVSDTTSQVVSAPVTAKLTFERPAVTSAPAPKPVAPPAAATPAPGTPAASPAADATTTNAVTPDIAQIAAAAVSPTDPTNIPNPTTGINAPDTFGAAIVKEAIALADAHTEEDCTMLVSRALLSAGVSFHGWPADYLKLGQITNNPQPGDLIYYQNGGGSEGFAHIAVFIGNNVGGHGPMAVHGGWDGHTTKIWSVNVGSGPIYIHVNR